MLSLPVEPVAARQNRFHQDMALQPVFHLHSEGNQFLYQNSSQGSPAKAKVKELAKERRATRERRETGVIGVIGERTKMTGRGRRGRRGRRGQRGRRGRRGQKRAKTVDTVEKESALRPKLAEAVPSGMCGMRNLRNLHLRKGRAKATKKTGSMGMGKESENSEDLFHATNVAGSTTSVTAPKMQRVKASTMGMLHPYTRTKSSWILKIRIPPSGSMDAWLARMARMSNTFEKSRAPQLTLPDKVQVKARQMNSYMCCCRVKMLRLWTRLSGSQMISLIPCLINMLHFKLKKVILWKVLASKREQIGRHATIVENEGTWRSDARNQNIKTTLRNRMQRERKDIEGLNGLLFFASEFAQDGALRFQLYDQHGAKAPCCGWIGATWCRDTFRAPDAWTRKQFETNL